MGEWPDDLLAGADHPRPLPPALRRRLEEQLLAGGHGDAARPLDPEFSDRLSEELSDPVAMVLTGVDGQRDLPPALREHLQGQLVRPHRRRRLLLAAAAVVVVLAGAGLAVQRLATSSSPPRPVASAPTTIGRNSFAAGGSSAAGGGAAGAATGAAGPAAGSPGAGAVNGQLPLAAAAQAGPSPIVPGYGPAAGGNWIIINGAGFTHTTSIRFGDATASRFTIISDGQVRVRAPAHHPGPVDVTVVSPAGARVIGSYLYLA